MRPNSPSQPTSGASQFIERRVNDAKRQLVAYGLVVGQTNIISAVEYLQARGVESHIIVRVALRLLLRREALQASLAISSN